MTKFSACIVTANLRDVDGCDSDAAIRAIMIAAADAADRYAEQHGIEIDLDEQPSDRNGKTVLVGHDAWGLNRIEELFEADQQALSIEDHLDRAISEAIQSGDWDDAA